MAVVATKVAQVAPPPGILQSTTAPLTASAFLVSVVIQAADYSTGVLLTNIATACGINTVTECVVVSVQVTAGTTQFGFGVHDKPNNKVRFFSAITNQTTATDYTAVNGDIWTLYVAGI